MRHRLLNGVERNEVTVSSSARDTGTPGSLNCQVPCEIVAISSGDHGESIVDV